MKPPLIRVEDHTATKIITTHYIYENNSISFPTTYKLIKSLLIHPACPHRRDDDTWPCLPCESHFTDKYWTSAATLLDYFADFFATDTSLMQSLWFHLLDIWQETATYLPFEAVMEMAEYNEQQPIWGSDRASAFQTNMNQTLELFKTVISGRKSPDSLIHNPNGEATCSIGDYETGPWLSGLTPWQQYLYNGSPGVSCSPIAPLNTNTNDNEEKGEEEEEETTQQKRTLTLTRYIPTPAIAIIKNHTAHTRSLAHSLFHQQEQEQEQNHNPTSLAENLATFDAHTLPIPNFNNDSHTYTSPLTGRTITYTLVNGAPPVMRYSGYGDAGMLAEDPEMNLLDECVGICRGVEAYDMKSGREAGEEGEDGDEDEDEDEEEDEMGEGVFDMWAVVESLDVEDGEAEKRKGAEGFGDMFDYWCGVDEV